MPFRALIIDDDRAFRHILGVRLRSFIPDLTVQEFDSLGGARTFLAKQKPLYFDLVVIDEHLGDGRGRDLLAEGWFRDLAVLSVSSDPSPEIPGGSLSAGATFFLQKTQVSEPLFRPLVLGIINRNKLQQELFAAKLSQVRMDTVRTLIATLRHEINNPLGAVLGAAFLLQHQSALTEDQREAAALVESSGNRIKHVLEQLCEAVSLDQVNKADHDVFHIPGDKPWEEE